MWLSRDRLCSNILKVVAPHTGLPCCLFPFSFLPFYFEAPSPTPICIYVIMCVIGRGSYSTSRERESHLRGKSRLDSDTVCVYHAHLTGVVFFLLNFLTPKCWIYLEKNVRKGADIQKRRILLREGKRRKRREKSRVFEKKEKYRKEKNLVSGREKATKVQNYRRALSRCIKWKVGVILIISSVETRVSLSCDQIKNKILFVTLCGAISLFESHSSITVSYKWSSLSLSFSPLLPYLPPPSLSIYLYPSIIIIDSVSLSLYLFSLQFQYFSPPTRKIHRVIFADDRRLIEIWLEVTKRSSDMWQSV